MNLSNAKALLVRLADAPSCPYPKEIIQEMIDRQEEMTPALLEVLADVLKRPAYYEDEHQWKVLAFSCYLLAQFRVTAAFKPLCAVLALPADAVTRLFEDMITEDMGKILASVYDGDPAPICALVEDSNVQEYVRGSSAVSFFLCLLQDGRISREWLEGYAVELLGRRLEREPSLAWDGWSCLCAELGFASTVPLLKKAIEEDLLDPWYFGFEKLLRNANGHGDERWKHLTGLIDDTIQATSSWPLWDAPPKPNAPAAPMKYVPTSAEPKVDRNDPCPCGSGKKYKKCCGAV